MFLSKGVSRKFRFTGNDHMVLSIAKQYIKIWPLQGQKLLNVCLYFFPFSVFTTWFSSRFLYSEGYSFKPRINIKNGLYKG
jgi:hypothetical protein